MLNLKIYQFFDLIQKVYLESDKNNNGWLNIWNLDWINFYLKFGFNLEMI